MSEDNPFAPPSVAAAPRPIRFWPFVLAAALSGLGWCAVTTAAVELAVMMHELADEPAFGLHTPSVLAFGLGLSWAFVIGAVLSAWLLRPTLADRQATGLVKTLKLLVGNAVVTALVSTPVLAVVILIQGAGPREIILLVLAAPVVALLMVLFGWPLLLPWAWVCQRWLGRRLRACLTQADVAGSTGFAAEPDGRPHDRA